MVKRSVKSEHAPKVSKRVELGADVLPRRTLQDAENVAQALHREYAGKGAQWDELARVLNLGAKSVGTKHLIWSAQAYGLITKD
jgi:hypothetical protein